MSNEHAQQQIRQAIRKAARRDGIRVLPTTLPFTYVYTCYRCGSHNCTLLTLGGGWGAEPIPICSYCGGMSDDNVGWNREFQRRVRSPGFLAVGQDEDLGD